MLVYYFVLFIVSNRYLLFWVSNGHNSVTVQNGTHVYVNFFHHKDLGNHLLQLCPKVVKHPVYFFFSLVHADCYLYCAAEFPHTDPYTNVGLVVSPIIDSSCGEGTSIKLIVHSKNEESPITFTCDGKDVFDNGNQVASYILITVKNLSIINHSLYYPTNARNVKLKCATHTPHRVIPIL